MPADGESAGRKGFQVGVLFPFSFHEITKKRLVSYHRLRSVFLGSSTKLPDTNRKELGKKIFKLLDLSNTYRKHKNLVITFGDLPG